MCLAPGIFPHPKKIPYYQIIKLINSEKFTPGKSNPILSGQNSRKNVLLLILGIYFDKVPFKRNTLGSESEFLHRVKHSRPRLTARSDLLGKQSDRVNWFP